MSDNYCCMCIEQNLDKELRDQRYAITMIKGNSLCMVHAKQFIKDTSLIQRQKTDLEKIVDALSDRLNYDV